MMNNSDNFLTYKIIGKDELYFEDQYGKSHKVHLTEAIKDVFDAGDSFVISLESGKTCCINRKYKFEADYDLLSSAENVIRVSTYQIKRRGLFGMVQICWILTTSGNLYYLENMYRPKLYRENVLDYYANDLYRAFVTENSVEFDVISAKAKHFAPFIVENAKKVCFTETHAIILLDDGHVTSRGINTRRSCVGLDKYSDVIDIDAADDTTYLYFRDGSMATVPAKPNNRTWYVEDNTIQAYSGNETDVIVPAVISDTKINAIGSYAFSPDADVIPLTKKKRKAVTKITIEDGISEIGYAAFKSCSSLTEIHIPTSLKKLYGHAFHDSSVESISIPEHVELPTECFSDCHKLKSYDLPKSMLSTPLRCFDNCSSLESVTLPPQLRVIECGTFCGCSSLKELDIPHTVNEIGDYAFSGCSSLTGITIPDGIERIGSSLFADCTELVSVHFPANLKHIHAWAFSGCSSLTEIDFPDGLEIIDAESFRNCKSLQSVIIPQSVGELRLSAFEGCSNLMRIILKGRTTEIIDVCPPNLLGNRTYRDRKETPSDAGFNSSTDLIIVGYPGSKAEEYAAKNGFKFECITD